MKLLILPPLQHLAIDVCRAVNMFVDHLNETYTSLVLSGALGHPTNIANTAVYSVQALLADSFYVRSLHYLVTFCSDLGSGKDLALLHCLGQKLVYNCPAHHHGPRRDRQANMNISSFTCNWHQVLAAAIAICWAFAKAELGGVVFDSVFFPCIISAFSMILVTNIVCTGV